MILRYLKIFLKIIKPNLRKNLRLKQRQLQLKLLKGLQPKKDKNIKGDYFAKIKEYTCMISDIYDSQQNTKEKLTDKFIKLQNLSSELKYAKYQNDLFLIDDILKKIDDILNDSLNIVWNMVCKQNRKNNEKITINKKTDINRYLEEFEKIVNKKIILLKRTIQKIENLITTIKNKIDGFNEKLHKSDKINKAEIESIKRMFGKFLGRIINNFNEIIK